MNVLAKKPLTIAEAKAAISDFEEKKELEAYLKKFGKLSKEKVSEIQKEISSLKNAKIREEDIVKVADFLPATSEEVNKIFTDVSLSEEEANKIIEVVSKYR